MGGEREAAGRQEEEGGARQRTQLGQRCGAGLGKDGVFEECKKVGVVRPHGTMERGWEEMKVERLARALKVRLRNLDCIPGTVGTMEGFLEGDD